MASIRGLARRTAAWLGTASSLLLALASTSCGGAGGGDNYAAKPMVLVEYLYVDRALVPSFPTGVQALPRNAQIVFSFSEIVDANTVNDQTISIRYGSQFQTVPKGSFQVSGSRVIFDPTVTQQGTPNPFGLEPVTQYNVELPSVGQANDVVRNLDNDPLLNSFFSSFTTAAGFLRELDPPSIVRVYFNPDQNALTKQVPGNAIMAIEFDEPMDPATFSLAVGPSVATTDGLDVRWLDLPDPNTNQANSLENVPIPGSITWDPSAKTFYFVPVFSFGDKKYVFGVQVFQNLKDLAGNPLINPRSFGPYTCDGTGKSTGKILAESFSGGVDNDTTVTSADWGFAVLGDLTGAPISSRRAYIAGYQLAQRENAGQYNPIVDPLTGQLLNNYIANIQPPTNLGRRVMWACDDTELGADGSVTTISWGPDSNATFAAQYPEVVLRIGFQKSSSLSLATTFSSNFLGTPLILYKGLYSVGQAANVGNEYTPAPNTVPFAQMQPLLLTGYVNWPAPTSFFDWSQGDPAVDGDSVMVFDANVAEGNTFQQIRGWFGVTAPNSGVLLGGFPLRRMYATFDEDTPNPQSNFVAGIINPEPSWTDTAFTITKRVSVAQSRFYTPGPSDPAGNSYSPPHSTQTTFGVKSNYEDAILSPSLQTGGAQVLVEYQGAMLLDTTSNRTKINTAQPSTPFTTSVDDCDGYPFLRWRITLTSNLISNTVARLASITVPIERLP